MLCRLDRVLKDTHDAVVAENKRIRYKNKAPFLTAISKRKFYNVSEFTFESLTSDSGLIRDNLIDYIKGFSENARTILESSTPKRISAWTRMAIPSLPPIFGTRSRFP